MIRWQSVRLSWVACLQWGVTVLLACHLLGWAPFAGMARLDGWWHDLRLSLARPVAVDSRVVVVDIDERSLATVGQWPWPRATVASLLDTLGQHYRVGVIGLDVVFAESGDNQLAGKLAALARKQPSLAPGLATLMQDAQQDAQLAHAMQRNPVVMGYYFDTSGRGVLQTGMLPEPVFDEAVAPEIQPLSASGFGANLPALQQAAGAAGHFNSWADVDGVNRRVPLLVNYHGNYYDTLSLAMLRKRSGDEPLMPVFGDGGSLSALAVGQTVFPLSRHATMPVPYVGPARSFPYYAAADVLARRIPPEALQGKMVLLGTTAPGLMDLRVTPFGQVYPGVEVHANLLNAALQGKLFRDPDSTAALLAVVILLGCLLPWLYRRSSPWAAGGWTLAIAASVLAANVWSWQERQLAWPVAVVMTQLFALYLLHVVWGYISESRRRRELSSVFGSYIPPALVEQMADAPERFLAQLQGERREMTVLFSDVRNFTSLSEGMPPDMLAALMNTYLSAQTRHIQQAAGTIDKYIGDAVMAFWGAPLADEAHARQAVLAAMQMVDALPALNTQFAKQGWPQLSIGVGVNSGIMTVGNMGSDFRRAYTVLGDEVNLAARLEALTKQYGVPILCGEQTRQAVPDVPWREVDWVRVKGRTQVVTIWQPLPVGDPAISELPRWQQVLTHYRAGECAEAALLLSALIATSPSDGLYQCFAHRLAKLDNRMSDDWDGIYQQSEK